VASIREHDRALWDKGGGDLAGEQGVRRNSDGKLVLVGVMKGTAKSSRREGGIGTHKREKKGRKGRKGKEQLKSWNVMKAG
jgi:hypothetical protein